MNGVRRIAVSTLLLLALGPIGTAWAQVKVTSAEPAASVQGTVSLDVTVNGSGFDSTANARFLVTGTSETGGVTVTKTVVKGPRQLIATIDVADGAVVNKFDIEVTLSSGRKGKGTTLFTVLKKAGDEPDPCIGAESRRFPSFAFTRQATINGVVTWKTILADATGQCERTATTYSYNTFSSDLSFRYDRTSRSGVIVRVGTGFSQQAARLSVTFDTNGVPAVETSSYSSILTSADLPIPPDLLADGATLVSIGSGYISPDGTALLVQTTLNDAAQSYIHLLWTCPFDSEILAVDRGNCRHVYQASFAEVSGSWGARGDAIYILQPAVSGSGMGLYRLTLADGSIEQIWSRGTLWTYASSALDSSLHERIAVYEADLTTRCARALVIDVDTCSDNDCLVLNGAGHPVRGVFSWLPDGRVVSDGQTAPSRKGQCSNSGAITAFDSNDSTSSTTTLVTDGVSPHGSGGG